MMNVSDAKYFKSSFDFEECTAIEIDSWTNISSQSSSMESITSTTSNSSSGSNNSNTSSRKDDNLITILAQSIEIFGSSVSPWPTAVSSKTLPEQVAGIFITSEKEEIKKQQQQQQQQPQPQPQPQIQSKLRRSTSSTRRLSISRINEENIFDAQRIFNELEPIPIISSEEQKSSRSRSPFSATTSASSDNSLFENQRKGSRLQNWLASLYSRSNNGLRTNNFKEIDEECAAAEFKKPLKGILKKSSGEHHVQKSVTISEGEAIIMSHTASHSAPVSPHHHSKAKKTMKLRFDNEVSVCETFHKEDYSRQSLEYVARQLTPSLALTIKKELNSVKQEMEVHEESRHLTQFYLIK